MFAHFGYINPSRTLSFKYLNKQSSELSPSFSRSYLLLRLPDQYSWSHRRAREVMTRVASDDQADVS
jgi:hypothetical protein